MLKNIYFYGHVDMSLMYYFIQRPFFVLVDPWQGNEKTHFVILSSPFVYYFDARSNQSLVKENVCFTTYLWLTKLSAFIVKITKLFRKRRQIRHTRLLQSLLFIGKTSALLSEAIESHIWQTLKHTYGRSYNVIYSVDSRLKISKQFGSYFSNLFMFLGKTVRQISYSTTAL